MKILLKCLLLLLPTLLAQGRITDCSELVTNATRLSGPRSEKLVALALEMLEQPYAAGTLGGGPGQPEVFSPRCDSLDCMTLLEVLLAASSLEAGSTVDDWADSLRFLRYEGGIVAWKNRRHFFTEWIAAGCVTDLAMQLPYAAKETLLLNQREAGRLWLEEVVVKHSEFGVIRHGALDRSLIRSGDLVGFRSSMSGLDVTHTGILIWESGDLMLVHASSKKGQVVMERLSNYASKDKGMVILRLP